MKLIDYNKTKGYFKIEYLEDGEIVNGSINVDESSLNINAVVAKLIINNSKNDVVIVEDKEKYEFKILEKEMDIVYNDVSEYDYFQQFKLYNERFDGIESKFKNVSEKNHFSEKDILFQFYYKSEEKDEVGTASYILSNYFNKGARISDDISPKGYYNEFDLLCRVFKTSFMANNDMNFEDYYYCSIQKTNSYGLNPLNDIINEITKRDVRRNLNDYFQRNNFEIFEGKKIIVVTDIIESSDTLDDYYDILKKHGAVEILLFSFAKASIKLGE